MADERVYSDEEFAVILRSAAQLSSRSDLRGGTTSGLTLAEMKSAAAQAGLDPALIERAARLMVARTAASPFERLIGGPLRHHHEVQFRAKLDEEGAARVLSAIRIAATHVPSMNDGHSSAQGVTFQASSEGDVLSVVARPDDQGTTASVVIDRSGTFVIAGLLSALAIGMSVLAGVGMYGEIPAIAPWIPVVGTAGVLAGVRAFWASSSRKARERIGLFIDTIGQTLSRPRE